MRRVRVFHAVLAVLTCAATIQAQKAPEAQLLPAIDEVVKQVLQRAELEGRNDFEFRQLYAYRRVRLKEEFAGDGELKNREELDRTHMPNPNRGPKPFIPKSSAPNSDKPANEREESEEMQKGRAFQKSDFPITDDLLKRFKFELLGRETVNGRSTLLVDFRPVSDSLPARNLKEKFINRAAGKVWVDEQDWALVRAELRLTSPVHVLGGLVGSVYRFRCEFSRDRTLDGYWYATNMQWRVEGRQLFTPKRISFREEKSEVRKIRNYPG